VLCFGVWNNISLLIDDVCVLFPTANEAVLQHHITYQQLLLYACFGSSQGMDTNLCSWELMKRGM
jgi:hypothetical protein